jgi:hypothetical protein
MNFYNFEDLEMRLKDFIYLDKLKIAKEFLEYNRNYIKRKDYHILKELLMEALEDKRIEKFDEVVESETFEDENDLEGDFYLDDEDDYDLEDLDE